MKNASQNRKSMSDENLILYRYFRINIIVKILITHPEPIILCLEIINKVIMSFIMPETENANKFLVAKGNLWTNR